MNDDNSNDPFSVQDVATISGLKSDESLWSEGERPSTGVAESAFVIDVEGFEGPLDLLLHLARNQKVDIAKISILKLAEQFIAFVQKAQVLKLELAADYLVMAAWLAYLKSRLLLPVMPDSEEQSGDELAAILQFRLKRLEALRQNASKLFEGHLLGRDVFARGDGETIVVEHQNRFEASLYDLLVAYATQRQRQAITHVEIAARPVWSLKEARSILMRLIGPVGADWIALDAYIVQFIGDEKQRRTALASSFAASLELVREGSIQVRQAVPFDKIYLKGVNEDTTQCADLD